MRTNYKCTDCGNFVPHRHMHDCAHGIAGTHMAGSERFECSLCGHRTHANQPGADLFPFVLDVPPRRDVSVAQSSTEGPTCKT